MARRRAPRLPGSVRSTMGALRGPSPMVKSGKLIRAVKRGDKKVESVSTYRERLKWGRWGQLGTRVFGWGELGAHHKAFGADYRSQKAGFRREAAEAAIGRAQTLRQLERAEKKAGKFAGREAKFGAKAKTLRARADRNANRGELWRGRENVLKTRRQKDIDRLARTVWEGDIKRLKSTATTTTDPAKRGEARGLLRAMEDVQRLPGMISNAQRTEAGLRALAAEAATPAADRARLVAEATRAAVDIIAMRRGLAMAQRRAAGRYNTGVLSRLREARLI